MEYFNGVTDVDVSDIDCLKDMTQETANAIATGPQDMFFTLLDRFNSDLTYYTGETIDVTDKWNWKPGTYPKIDKMLLKRLNFDKKSSGIANRISKIRERANYLNYILRNAHELETQKHRLKLSGLTKNVDICEFQSKATDLVSRINTQCDLAYDMSEGRVSIKPYISSNFTSRQTPIYLDIKLSELTMSIYSGDKSIQEIPLSPIHLIFNYSFRHYINNISTNWKITGQYGDDNIRFPYISSRGRYSQTDNGFGTVCLDKYNEDIKKSFINVDYIQMAMHLMNWAQYYSVNHSNPYNNLKFLHYGLPKGYSKEYRATLSSAEGDCSNRILNITDSKVYPSYFDELEDKMTICNDIECQLKESCNFFKMNNHQLSYSINKEDEHYQIESMVGYIVEHIYSLDESSRDYLMDNSINYRYTSRTTEEEIIKYLFRYIYRWDISYSTLKYSITGFYTVLQQSYNYCPVTKNVSNDVLSKKDIQQEMLAWATNPGRRQDGTR